MQNFDFINGKMLYPEGGIKSISIWPEYATIKHGYIKVIMQ